MLNNLTDSRGRRGLSGRYYFLSIDPIKEVDLVRKWFFLNYTNLFILKKMIDLVGEVWKVFLMVAFFGEVRGLFRQLFF